MIVPEEQLGLLPMPESREKIFAGFVSEGAVSQTNEL
jgi:hypothetical protein